MLAECHCYFFGLLVFLSFCLAGRCSANSSNLQIQTEFLYYLLYIIGYN